MAPYITDISEILTVSILKVKWLPSGHSDSYSTGPQFSEKPACKEHAKKKQQGENEKRGGREEGKIKVVVIGNGLGFFLLG